MGGRIYDPVLGRFLQADPMIQAPENIQSLNRYSYVMNNPLNKTDPSGYIWVTLVTMALKYIAANTTSIMLAKAISFVLTAYEFYSEVSFYVSVIKALGGNSAEMAQFAGGLAKSYAKSAAINFAIQVTGLDSIDREYKKKMVSIGNPGTDMGEVADKAAAAGCTYETVAKCGKAGRFERISKQTGLKDGFEIKGLNNSVFVNDDTGFKSALFKDRETGKYLLAFAGTDSLNDIDDIVGHFFGVETSQHREVAILASAVDDAVGGELSFTGHSLGGALATTAVKSTGREATIFNSQGYNFGSLSKANINRINKMITSYKSSLDLLSIFQDVTPLTHNAAGSQRSLGSAGFHSIKDMCYTLGTSCSYD